MRSCLRCRQRGTDKVDLALHKAMDKRLVKKAQMLRSPTFWIALLAFIAALSIWLLERSVVSSHRVVSEPFLAARMSHSFVEKRLNIPATAKFQDVYEATVRDLGDGVYTVLSYVDALNPSGAPFHVRYFCKLKEARDGTWQLIDLKISE